VKVDGAGWVGLLACNGVQVGYAERLKDDIEEGDEKMPFSEAIIHDEKGLRRTKIVSDDPTRRFCERIGE